MNTRETENANKTHGDQRLALPAKAALGSPVSAASTSTLLRLKPSRQYAYWMCVLHVTSVLSLLLAALPFVIQVVFILVLLISLYQHLRLIRSMPTFYLHPRLTHQWVLQSEEKPDEFLMIESCYYHSSWLIILRIKTADSVPALRRFGRYYPILSDSCNPDHFRQIRVLAKFFINGKASKK